MAALGLRLPSCTPSAHPRLRPGLRSSGPPASKARAGAQQWGAANRELLLRGGVASNRLWGAGNPGGEGEGSSLGRGRQPRPMRVRSVQKETFQGVYGPWSVEDSDKAEVWLYRAGLNVAAFSLAAAALPALLPPSYCPPLPEDALFWTGAMGLGASLLLIHIYVTPIKRTLQAFWAAGVVGALALSWNIHGGSADVDPAGTSLVRFVVDHPAAVWGVGPLFAALTGLVFKEGLCYGKLEAALLVLVIPSLLLGHLSGLMSADVERVLLASWVLLSLVFALRKFTQPIKDDIGDKSVFMFQAMPREQQEKLLRSLQGPEREQ